MPQSFPHYHTPQRASQKAGHRHYYEIVAAAPWRAGELPTGEKPKCIRIPREREPPLQRLASPQPAVRLLVYRAHQEGSSSVGQLGDHADQLTVKVVRPVLV